MAQLSSLQQPDSVERIRDIIFGTTMRDYDQRFEALLRDVGRLQAEVARLNELLAAKDAAQTRNLQGVRQELSQATSDLRAETRAELTRLGAQLVEQSNHHGLLLQGVREDMGRAEHALQDALAAGMERLSGQLADEAAARATDLQGLRQECQHADQDLRDELRQIAQRLTDTKTDRSLLGDLFIELGSHLKTGGGLAELLKGLEQTD